MNAEQQVEARMEDGTCFVRLSGEIDIANATRIAKAVDKAAGKTHRGMVLDLSDTTYLDSAGIALLFRMAQRLRVRRQPMRLVVSQDAPVRAVLDLSGLTRLVPVVVDPTQAAAEIAQART